MTTLPSAAPRDALRCGEGPGSDSGAARGAIPGASRRSSTGCLAAVRTTRARRRNEHAATATPAVRPRLARRASIQIATSSMASQARRRSGVPGSTRVRSRRSASIGRHMCRALHRVSASCATRQPRRYSMSRHKSPGIRDALRSIQETSRERIRSGIRGGAAGDRLRAAPPATPAAPPQRAVDDVHPLVTAAPQVPGETPHQRWTGLREVRVEERVDRRSPQRDLARDGHEVDVSIAGTGRARGRGHVMHIAAWWRWGMRNARALRSAGGSSEPSFLFWNM